MTDSDTLMTLDEVARLIPGATPASLKRLARKGKLTCYRPGKAYLTTAADVQRAVDSCRVGPKVQDSGSAPRAATRPARSPMSPHGTSSTALAKSALDSALARLPKRKTAP